MPMLERNQLILVKSEAIVGTDSVPTGANAINAAPVEWSFDPESLQRPEINRSLDDAEVEMGRKLVNFTIRVSLKGSGVVGTAPQFSPLIKACAYKETVTALTSVAYTPSSVSADHISCTIYLYEDGKVIKAVGCYGNWSLANNAGQIPVITFNMQGKFASQSDAATPTPTFETSTAVIVQSAGISFGGFNTAKVRSLNFSSGNKLVERKDCNATDGLDSMFVGGRNATFSATVEAELEATKAFFGNVLARTKESVDFTNGTVAGNIVTITAPKCLTNTISPTSDSGIRLYQLGGQCRANVGDDNISIVLT